MKRGVKTMEKYRELIEFAERVKAKGKAMLSLFLENESLSQPKADSRSERDERSESRTAEPYTGEPLKKGGRKMKKEKREEIIFDVIGFILMVVLAVAVYIPCREFAIMKRGNTAYGGEVLVPFMVMLGWLVVSEWEEEV